MNVSDQIATPLSITPVTPLVYNTEKPTPIVPKKAMELFPLYNDKNPMLAMRQLEFNVNNPPCNIIEFCNQLLYTMGHYGGVGLAAPQCGFPYRIFVMAGGIVCINPVIEEYSKDTTFSKEGCLSFPALYLNVTRPETIRIKYTNEFGAPVEAVWNGATARVAQHEYDHLEGKVFTKLVGNLTLQMAQKKRKKLFKRIQQAVDHKARQLRISGKDKTYGKPMKPTQVPTTAIITHREN